MENITDSFWEATYRQNIARMIGVCCRYTQNRETAEDLAHDAFLVAINKVASFENKGPFEAWLRRIVVNIALQYLREQKKQQNYTARPALHPVWDDISEENAANENLTFSEAELLEAISFLPEHHRLVFNLYVVDNYTHAQIAAQLGISEGTSKSHLARARKKIRELLNNHLKKNKERKRAFLLLILPSEFWNIDHLVKGKLKNLSIQPLKRLSPGNNGTGNMSAADYKPSGVSSTIYLKTGLMAIAAVFVLGGAPNRPVSFNNANNEPEQTVVSKAKAELVLLSDANAEDSSIVNSKSKKDNSPTFSDTITATISNNPILVKKTKTLEEMKNLKTIGGLLLTSLTFDSAALSTALPFPFKNQEITENRRPEPKVAESVKPDAKRNDKPLEGTFYASKIFWSEKNNELFLLGDRVKVNLNTQKFTGNGTFSFINRFSYLIVDGTPVKLNETVKLADKKYRLVELRPAEGIKKYGDNGKDGVVEITLDE